MGGAGGASSVGGAAAGAGGGATAGAGGAISGAATGVVRKRAPARARESAHTGSLLFNNTSSTPNIPAVIANKTPIDKIQVFHSVNPHAPMIVSLPICAIAHWK